MPKVIAAIPTYNSAELATLRVRELLKSNFYRIIVCDDNSSDNTTELLLATFGDAIDVVSSQKNLGPGGNRNQVLATSSFKESDYTFFLDADCEIIYDGNITELIKNSFQAGDTGVVGFSLQNKHGELMRWNYGDLMHPAHEASDQVLEKMLNKGDITKEQFKEYAPARAASFRMLPEPRQKEVGWVAEGCFAIRSRLYEQIGGFTPAMRYHEAHDLNAKVQKAGYKTMFNPTTLARHLAYDSRMERRSEDEEKGRLYYYQTHWGMSENVFSYIFDRSDEQK